MSVLSLARAALLLGLVYVCYSKPLSKKQIDYFKSHAEEWGAPAIEKVLNGTMEKTDRKEKMTLIYQGENKEGEVENCTMFLRQRKKGLPSHGWTCVSTTEAVKKNKKE